MLRRYFDALTCAFSQSACYLIEYRHLPVFPRNDLFISSILVALLHLDGP